MKKLRVAIIGQGRSGRDIHGNFFKSESNDFCQVVYVVEADATRREKAAGEYGCPVAEHYTGLFAHKDEIDLVVNASYSQMHYSITKDLLEHGFNVLVEKPMGRTYWECMDLIETAKQAGVVFTAFQQTLFAPHFLKAKELMEQGTLGEINQINIKYSSFSRRWDWQTLQVCCGGGIYNSGPHPFGQGLALLGWDPATKIAYSNLKTVLTSGDSDDYAKIILAAPGKPTVDIEVNSTDAFASDYVIKLYGSKGSALIWHNRYKLKYVEDFSQFPPRPLIRGFLSNENGDPAYCSEKLTFVEQEDKIVGNAFEDATCNFYKMMYNSVLEGAPLQITPQQGAMVIAAIEACHAQNPLPVKFI